MSSPYTEVHCLTQTSLELAALDVAKHTRSKGSPSSLQYQLAHKWETTPQQVAAFCQRHQLSCVSLEKVLEGLWGALESGMEDAQPDCMFCNKVRNALRPSKQCAYQWKAVPFDEERCVWSQSKCHEQSSANFSVPNSYSIGHVQRTAPEIWRLCQMKEAS